jgi:hypothetical protein
MANPLAGKRKKAGEGDDTPATSGATASRHRQLIEAAVVASEIAAAAVADSRALDYSRHVVARPHLDGGRYAAPRHVPVCERCGSNIDTLGIAIIQRRTVRHVRCDLPESA